LFEQVKLQWLQAHTLLFFKTYIKIVFLSSGQLHLQLLKQQKWNLH